MAFQVAKYCDGTGGKFVALTKKSRAETKPIAFTLKTKQKVSKKLI
jgi:hypothetical protein